MLLAESTRLLSLVRFGDEKVKNYLNAPARQRGRNDPTLEVLTLK